MKDKKSNYIRDHFNLLPVLVFVSWVSLASILLPIAVSADSDIQFYKIDVDIDEEGRSEVQLVMTFERPETHFSFNIIGRVENFEATSNAGPVDCEVDVSGTSSISCEMNLTGTKKELQMSFETGDFVKTLDETFYFSGDLSPHMHVTEVSATLKLPHGSLLVGEDISSSILSYPKSASAHIAGDNIIVIWKLYDISATDTIKFEVLYEQVITPAWFQLRMRHFILFGATFAVVLGLIVVRYLRKSEDIVLSVLDEYERKIMDIITKEGEVKQKRVVQLTNLSKAKVSRVVKNLAGRGLVEVERIGRTNRLRAIKKKLRI